MLQSDDATIAEYEAIRATVNPTQQLQYSSKKEQAELLRVAYGTAYGLGLMNLTNYITLWGMFEIRKESTTTPKTTIIEPYNNINADLYDWK